MSSNERILTVQEGIEECEFGIFQLKVILLCAFSWMADAMELSILSFLGPILLCEWHISKYEEALLSAIVFGGMTVGSWPFGWFSDKFGRKTGIVFCCFWALISGVLSSMALNLVWMLIVRFILGVGIAGLVQSVTLTSEFLPVKLRARGVYLMEIFWSMGSGFAMISGAWIIPLWGWRALLIFCAVPMLVFLGFSWWLPESIMFDIVSGNEVRARKTLDKIADSNRKPRVEGNLVVHLTKDRGKIKDLFLNGYALKTVLLLVMWFGTLFSYFGISLLASEFLQLSKGQTMNEVYCMSVQPLPNITQQSTPETCHSDCYNLQPRDYIDLTMVNLSEIPGVIATMFVVEWLGRKNTIVIETALYGAFLMLMLVCTPRYMSIIFLMGARMCISSSFQTLYLYTVESYPTSMRAVALGTCSGFARIGAMLTPLVAQVLMKQSFLASLCIYCVVALCATVATLFQPSETKGKFMSDTKEDELELKEKS